MQNGRGLSVGIRDVWRRYGPITAVAGVSLDIAAGEFISLLGPSGSGKTTLLMMLAGFEQPDQGRLTVGERDMTRVAPNKRNVALVFQRYALFPHMTVAENIAFPLRTRRMSRADRDRKVTEALAMVKLEGYAARKPAELSGGQQQRVALARAIVFDPPVILMDEPLGALDRKLRQHMQIELKQLQRRLGATVIYVTHDQEEALTMSDRIAVMNEGRLAQVGTPRMLYDQPANSFVATFIGETNLLPGIAQSVHDERCIVRIAGATVSGRVNSAVHAAQQVQLAVRPEQVLLDQGPGVGGCVVQMVYNGPKTAVMIELPGGAILRADAETGRIPDDLRPGCNVVASWRDDDAIVFGAEQ